MEEHLISRCGIYCGACYVYRDERDCGDFIREVAEWQKVELDQIKCNGCLAPKVEKWTNCQKCRPQYCLKEKELQYCHECDEFWDYSCETYKGYEDFCSKRGENIRQNMIKIMADAPKWLEEQDKKWRCSSCREPYAW